MEWRHKQLSSEAKKLLIRLRNVFNHSSFSVEAALAIFGKDLPITEFESLKQNFLLEVVQGSHGNRRYRLVSSRTLVENEFSYFEDEFQHLKYYLNFLEKMEPNLIGNQQQVTLETIEQELSNIRLALEFCSKEMEHRKEISSLALRLLGSLSRFWWMRGHSKEGFAWTKHLLELMDNEGEPLIVAKALRAAGVLAQSQGYHKEAQEYYKKSLVAYESSNDLSNTASKQLSNLTSEFFTMHWVLHIEKA